MPADRWWFPERRQGAPRRSTAPAVGLGIALGLLLAIPPAFANGGTLRFLGNLGPWEVAVFTDPTPPSADSLDVSVLVTLPGRPEPVEGVEIEVELRLPADPEVRLLRPATREEADDPRYRAAKFRPGRTGDWVVEVRVRDATGQGGIGRFDLPIRPPGILSNPLLTLLLSLIPLAGVAWWLLRPRNSGAGESTSGTR